MGTLSELGRTIICNRIGISDKNSIFIKNEEAFNDRISLLNVYYNIDNMIDAYIDELSHFDSEEEYIKYLKESEETLYTKLEIYINVADVIEQKFSKYNDITHKIEVNTFKNVELGKYILRIYFDTPVYSSIEYLIRIHKQLPYDFNEYVYRTTGSKFIATLADLDINKFNKDTQKIIYKAMKVMSNSIMGLTSPKFINPRELISTGLAEVKYLTSPKRSIESLDAIVNNLRNHEVLQAKNVCIDIYKEYKPFENSDIICRKSISDNFSENAYNIEECDNLSLIYYFRKETNTNISEYDRYFEIDGHEAKLLSDIRLY